MDCESQQVPPFDFSESVLFYPIVNFHSKTDQYSRGAEFYHGGFLNVSFHQKLGKNNKVHKISKLSLKKLIQGPYF